MASGDAVKARRRAREIVAGMRWCGMTLPPLYARMARAFQDLVRSGDYAAWVAANQASAMIGRKPHEAGLSGLARLDRSGAATAAPRARRTAAPRAPRPGLLLPGPASGR